MDSLISDFILTLALALPLALIVSFRAGQLGNHITALRRKQYTH